MKNNILILLLLGPIGAFAQTLNGFELSKALINPLEIKKGGPPRDGIPAIDNPVFTTAANASFLNDSDLVIGLSIENKAKAYPVAILNYHEIVNDSLNNQPVLVTYCPLCGSGMVFSALIKGKAHQFGVSGLLYNSDVLLYDKETESLWSQMMMKSINGSQRGNKLTIIHSDLTTWKDWKAANPNTLVLSTNTGFRRDYTKSPYRGYTQMKKTYFPVSATNDKLPSKERVLGIQVKNGFKAYPYSLLAKQNGIIKDVYKGIEISIRYNSATDTAVLLSPQEISSVSSYWFAWYAFHPYTKVYKAD